MKESILFYKKLTPAEAGVTGTHEVYVRLPNSFDYKTFFGDDAQLNGTVIECFFNVVNLTEGHEFDDERLRFVYYVNNANKEKRIPSLTSLFRENSVEAGDYFFLERKETAHDKQYRIYFMKPSQIISTPSAAFYSKFDDVDQLIQVISEAGKDEYTIQELQNILMRYFKIKEKQNEPKNLKTVGHSFGMEFGKYLQDRETIREVVNGLPNLPLQGGYLGEAIKFGVELYNATSLHLFGLSFWESDSNTSSKDNKKQLPSAFKTLQKIFYGAPGTGKSFYVNKLTKGFSVIRTTFHPDSDYSTFVGAYKPIMEEAESRVVPVVLNNGASFEQNVGTYKEKRISYKFVKQSFLKAYLLAWKKYTESTEQVEPQFLVIEEINRGNCAQIFGDLFQLLDRNDDTNFSTYPIEADTDLQKEIDFAFKNEDEYKLLHDIDIDGVIDDYKSNNGTSISRDVQEGRVLLLPPNLYIWATMNTSDQSLFPIDSAFKRRWKWDYIKISNAYQRNDDGSYKYNERNERIPLGWQIKLGDKTCDWWQFIQAINEKIASTTISDDKKIGYFFCKPGKGTNLIDEQNFVGKVIFYLWNDVFKDNDTSLFKVTDTKKEPSFDDFYVENEQGFFVPNINAILRFLINVMGEEFNKNLGLQENQETE